MQIKHTWSIVRQLMLAAVAIAVAFPFFGWLAAPLKQMMKFGNSRLHCGRQSRFGTIFAMRGLLLHLHNICSTVYLSHPPLYYCRSLILACSRMR